MDLPGIPLPPHYKAFVDRFVNACAADDRVLAAFLGGSYAKGYADAYSDIDLCLITSGPSFDEFYNRRETFLRLLGDLVFLEDFDTPNIAFYIYADGTEGELYFGSENNIDQIHSGSFKILVDKKNVLSEVVFPPFEPAYSEQAKKLRRQIYGFWHELSHFVTAMRRGQLWWAHGQLEAMRWICVNLVRLQNNFLDEGAGEEAYFKVENEISVEQLESLKRTFPPLEREAMLKAVFAIISFYQELAPPLAQSHQLLYSHNLERVMIDRLQKLHDAHLRSESE